MRASTKTLARNIFTRRKFLQLAGYTSAACSLPFTIQANNNINSERTLKLYNLHTHENLETCYWSLGHYQQENLEKINFILRDHRTDEVHSIDPTLLDLLYQIHCVSRSEKPFNIISGYRSAKTNKKLRNTTSGVAKKSLHMQGKAIDICLPDVSLTTLRDIAISFNAGGVGYYANSGFLHIDIGRPRSW